MSRRAGKPAPKRVPLFNFQHQTASSSTTTTSFEKRVRVRVKEKQRGQVKNWGSHTLIMPLLMKLWSRLQWLQSHGVYCCELVNHNLFLTVRHLSLAVCHSRNRLEISIIEILWLFECSDELCILQFSGWG